MRLSKMKSSSGKEIYYVIQDVTRNEKRSTKIVETLGTLEEIKKNHNSLNPEQWMNEHLNELNKKHKEDTQKVLVSLSSGRPIALDQQRLYNGGYLFLKKIYYELELDTLCAEIQKKYRFKYNLNEILESLLYGRIIYPGSKLSTFTLSKHYLEQPSFALQDMYRSLDVLAKEFNTLQAHVYKSSKNLIERDTSVLYYDCTNFYFEIEKEKGSRQYGVSKENRPNPLIEMGLYMDGSGIPLAIGIHSGNTSEQETAIPLSMTIQNDFRLQKFVYCADAGLGSNKIKKFHNTKNHSYIVTQSLKKLKKHLKEWSLDPIGWSLPGSNQKIDLRETDQTSKNKSIYYKERWINENGLEERLIVSFSPVYKEYLRTIRNGQINRADKLVEKQSTKTSSRQTDPKRLIKSEHITSSGEIAEEELVTLNTERIQQEEQYDGYYAVVTTLEDDIQTILSINRNRWEIEETFRLMKTNLEARPVYLQLDERIKAHFLTCFLALLFYRILEKQLPQGYSATDIISTLRNMNYLKLDEGYIPTYTRSTLTDDLHQAFNLPLDTEIIPNKRINSLLRSTKK